MVVGALRRRLSSLLDRDLVSREGLDYSITESGLKYLERVGKAPRATELPYGVTKYADNEVGRTILEPWPIPLSLPTRWIRSVGQP